MNHSKSQVMKAGTPLKDTDSIYDKSRLENESNYNFDSENGL